MSVERQFNWLGQQRVDVPHLRTIDSSNANDFDNTVGQSLAGGQPLVVNGFVLATTGAVGQPADALQLVINPTPTSLGLLWHPSASENGTVFRAAAGTAPEVLSSTNPRVNGSFTASQLNYVGIDLLRATDPSTSDLVEFLDADTLEEEPETVPLARTLNYSIVISTSDFTSQPNILPIALVTTDASNNVATIQDARNMAFRLGTGGTVPNPYNGFAWTQGRDEFNNSDGFSGGDKVFTSLHDAMQGIESRLQELGGGPFWYSATSDRHVKFVRNLGTRFPTGDNFFLYPNVSTTVVSGQTLPLSTINITPGIVPTTGPNSIPSNGGTASITTGAGVQTVTFTGITTSGGFVTALTGATGGSGTTFSGSPLVMTPTDMFWQGLAFVFCNALDLSGNTIYENFITDQATQLSGLTDLQVGDCLYVDVNEQPLASSEPLYLNPTRVNMSAMGMPLPPYTRWVIAWRTTYGYFTRDSQFGVGTTFQPASTVANGMVTLNQTPVSATNPVVVIANGAEAAIATGLSRGATGTAGTADFGAGTLLIGNGLSDTAITLGSSSITSQTLTLGYGPSIGGHTTTLGGNAINIGTTSTTPVITIGSGTGDSLTIQTVTTSITGGTSAGAIVNILSGTATAYSGTSHVNIYSNLTGASSSGRVFIGNGNTNPWEGYLFVGDPNPYIYLPPNQSANFMNLAGGLNVLYTNVALTNGNFTQTNGAFSGSSLESFGVSVTPASGAADFFVTVDPATSGQNALVQYQTLAAGLGTAGTTFSTQTSGSAAATTSFTTQATSTGTANTYITTEGASSTAALIVNTQSTSTGGALTSLTTQTTSGNAVAHITTQSTTGSSTASVNAQASTGAATSSLTSYTTISSGTPTTNIGAYYSGDTIPGGTTGQATVNIFGSSNYTSTINVIAFAGTINIGNEGVPDTINIGNRAGATTVGIAGTSIAVDAPTVNIGNVTSGTGSRIIIGQNTGSGAASRITIGEALGGGEGANAYLGFGGVTGWNVEIGTGASTGGNTVSIGTANSTINMGGPGSLVAVAGTFTKVDNISTAGNYGVNTTIGAHSSGAASGSMVLFNSFGASFPSKTGLYRLEVVFIANNNSTGGVPAVTASWWDPLISPPLTHQVNNFIGASYSNSMNKIYDTGTGYTVFFYSVVFNATVGGGPLAQSITVGITTNYGSDTGLTSYGYLTAL